jgi:hypothetical protein
VFGGPARVPDGVSSDKWVFDMMETALRIASWCMESAEGEDDIQISYLRQDIIAKMYKMCHAVD